MFLLLGERATQKLVTIRFLADTASFKMFQPNIDFFFCFLFFFFNDWELPGSVIRSQSSLS